MAHIIDNKLAFLGAGIIAGVWIERLLSTGSATPDQVLACDIDATRLETLHGRFGVRTSARNAEGAEFASLVILAPPPSEIPKVAQEIVPFLSANHVVVSLAAGWTLQRLDEQLGEAQVLRIMPNTPALVGEAMNLVSYGSRVTPDGRALIETLLAVLGSRFEVPDEEMNIWCALCSVGPTYLLPIIEALASAAAAKGVPADKASSAAAQVMAGTARMVTAGSRSPAELKEMISLRTLREGEAAKLFSDAFEEAVNKLNGLTRRLMGA